MLALTTQNPSKPDVHPNNCYIKATLYHLDGTTSEILTTLPNYSNWTEYLELGQSAMREYINNITRHWIKISHFFVEVGSVETSGEFRPIFCPIRHQVPLNKVYKSGTLGKWVTPDTHPYNPKYDQRGSSIDLPELVRIVTERQESIFHKLDDNTTQCGIPYESRGYYFRNGDLPADSFERNGRTYLVVYSFNKLAKKGGDQ